MSLDAFRQLLPLLMSEDNNLRTKAEQDYKDLLPQQKLEYLILILRERVDSNEILHLDSILLRRLFRVNIHNQLIEAGVSLKPYKDELINLLKQPIDLNLKKKIADAAAELDKKLIQSLSDLEEYQWPEFMKYLFDCIVSPELADKEIALNIISYSPTLISKHLYEEEQCFTVLKQFFLHCLSDDKQVIDFRIEAVKSVSAFIQAYCEDEGLIKQLGEIVIVFMNLIVLTLKLEEDYCDTILKAVQDLAEKCTYILKPNFVIIFELFVKTMLNNEIEDGRRRLCLEIIVTLAEAVPQTIRKRKECRQYLPEIVNHLLLMMTDLEDDDLEEWTNSDEIENEDYDSNVVVSETSLDRLATALGGKIFLPLALQTISEMCKNESTWKYKHAGLMAIATIGEGCHDQMVEMLPSIVNGILPFLDNDPKIHPKIKHAACNAIGQLSTDFQPGLQDKFHQQVMHKLLTLFSLNENPRVQAHAAAAMVNFLEGCSSLIIKQHIDFIAEKIEHVLNIKMTELAEKGRKLVLEQTIVTLSSLADSAQEHFVKYYDKFFPLLKYIIQNAINPELRLLRGKAIECISLIALSVGKEKFCSDAADIMNLLLKTQTGETEIKADDPQLVYIIASWSRICKILGPDFQPYLPYVMPQILNIAKHKIEVTLLDKEDVAEVEENEEVQRLDHGEDTFSINTTGLEEKATACQMIICYAKELKYAFVDYVEETTHIMIPLLNFYFHERVRTAAAECLPYLLESGKVKGEEFIKGLWSFIFPDLLKAIEYEPEKDVLCDMFASLASCIECVGKKHITDGQINQITVILQRYIEDHFSQVEARKQRRGDEDYDEGVERELIEEDDEDCYILSKISEVIHALFIVFRETFLPYFEILLPLFIKLAGSDRSPTEIQWSTCIMDDVIEYAGPHSLKYKDFFLPLMINGVRSDNPEIRQSAAYGFGVMGKNGGPAFAQDCAASIPILIQMIQNPESRSESNNLATENAISSVTKIMHFNNSHLNVNEIIPVWFTWLPCWEDEAELPYIYNFLFMLIENKHPAILGENNSNLPRLLYIMAELLCREVIETTSEVYQKIVMFLNSLKADQTLLLRALEELNNHPNHISQLRLILNV